MKPGLIVILLLIAVAIVVLIYNIGWNNGLPPGQTTTGQSMPAEPVSPVPAQ